MKIKNLTQNENLTLLCAFIGLFDDRLSDDQKFALEKLRRRNSANLFTLADQNTVSVLASTVLLSICNDNPQSVMTEQ